MKKELPAGGVGSSVAHHMLGSYQRSFLAILLAQFTRKRFSGGMSGVVRLAERSAPVQARSLAPCDMYPRPARKPHAHAATAHPCG